MKAYGLTRKDVNSLEWWSGSKSSTGNKTKSKIKKASRTVYKKIVRAKQKNVLCNDLKKIGDIA